MVCRQSLARSSVLGLRAVYIAMVLLLLGTAGTGVVFLIGLPWLEPANAVSDTKGDPGKGDPEPVPLRSNAEIKGDRLAVRTPDPTAEAPLRPSMTLDTAKQFMSVPL